MVRLNMMDILLMINLKEEVNIFMKMVNIMLANGQKEKGMAKENYIVRIIR